MATVAPISSQQCFEIRYTKNGGFNVKRKYLLILFILALLPCSFATDEVVSGYFEPGGMYGGHSGYYEWVNYCPNCHHYNCLSDTLKPCPEGQISCYICDSDFDGCTGYDKWGGSYIRGALIPYVEPEPEPVIQENQTTENVTVQPTPTPLEIAKTVYVSNKII